MFKFSMFLVGLLLSVSAHAITPITSCGTISTTDEYYLANDLTVTSSTGECLLVTGYYGASINMNGKTITCAPSNKATAIVVGIRSVSYSNLKVFGGSITGCWAGIDFGDTAWTRVQEVDLSGNTYMGINGNGHTFRSILNKFNDIKGYAVEGYAIGINTNSDGCIIHGNTFKNLHRQPTASSHIVGEGVAILVGTNSTGCTITNNWIENSVETGNDIAMWLASGGSGHVVRRNTIVGFWQGVTSPASGTLIEENVFWIRGSMATSLGAYGTNGTAQRNQFTNYVTPVGGGMSVGTGNTVYP